MTGLRMLRFAEGFGSARAMARGGPTFLARPSNFVNPLSLSNKKTITEKLVLFTILLSAPKLGEEALRCHDCAFISSIWDVGPYQLSSRLPPDQGPPIESMESKAHYWGLGAAAVFQSGLVSPSVRFGDVNDNTRAQPSTDSFLTNITRCTNGRFKSVKTTAQYYNRSVCHDAFFKQLLI